MKPRRIFTVVALAGLVVLAPGSALAKGDFEFVISGVGLLQPVVVTSSDVYAAVRGEIWSPADPPSHLSGPAYALDFYDTNSGHRTHNGRWLYYPAAGGALIARPTPAPRGTDVVRWQRFSPAFQDVLNRAIRSKPSAPLSLALGLGLVTVSLIPVVLLSRKRVRFTVA